MSSGKFIPAVNYICAECGDYVLPTRLATGKWVISHPKRQISACSCAGKTFLIPVLIMTEIKNEKTR